MLTALRTLVAPAAPAVSLDIARQHCRIDADYDDGLLVSYVQVATEWAQSFLNRALITQTLRWTIAHNGNHGSMQSYGYGYGGAYGLFAPLLTPYNIGRGIELPRAPLQTVTEVRFGYPDNGLDVVLDPATDYSVDVYSEPGRVHIPSQCYNPSFHHLSISYTAGYGLTSSTIPAPIRHAILLYTSSLYENRGDTETTLPPAAEHLLWMYRMVEFG